LSFIQCNYKMVIILFVLLFWWLSWLNELLLWRNGSARHTAKTICELTSTCVTAGQNCMTRLNHY
jgi:hypothetical protein